jgi:formate hydrogenlyase subunit 3/multisubunit Na+/H+ antiporter MnhD subunit
MVSISSEYWKVILGVSILITVLCLISLPTLYEDISGDGVQNLSPQGPPIEYQWDATISRIVIAIIFLAVSIYSYNQITEQSNR